MPGRSSALIEQAGHTQTQENPLCTIDTQYQLLLGHKTNAMSPQILCHVDHMHVR